MNAEYQNELESFHAKGMKELAQMLGENIYFLSPFNPTPDVERDEILRLSIECHVRGVLPSRVLGDRISDFLQRKRAELKRPPAIPSHPI